MYSLIDPPTPWDSLATWERFLVNMDELVKKHPDDTNAKSALKEARHTVRMKKKHGDSWPLSQPT